MTIRTALLMARPLLLPGPPTCSKWPRLPVALTCRLLVQIICMPVLQVFQGVILASRDRFQKNSPLGTLPPFGGSVTSPEGYLLALWVHECQRVFSDKMITLEDKAWIEAAIKELCKASFVPDLVKQVGQGKHVLNKSALQVPDLIRHVDICLWCTLRICRRMVSWSISPRRQRLHGYLREQTCLPD